MSLKHVLLIGEYPDLVEHSKELRQDGNSVRWVYDGREAMDTLVLEKNIDGILIEEQLDVSHCAPYMQKKTKQGARAGEFIVRTARELGIFTPIVFLKELGSDAERHLKDFKMMTYLPKTTNPFDVVEHLESELEKHITEEKRKEKAQSIAEISLVSREPDLEELVKIIFETKGYTVRSLGTGYAALSRLSRNKPDLLVLLNIMLPELDGFEFAKEVRKKYSNKELPILACSVKGYSEDFLDHFGGLIDAYLSKPFDLDELHLVVEKLLA